MVTKIQILPYLVTNIILNLTKISRVDAFEISRTGIVVGVERIHGLFTDCDLRAEWPDLVISYQIW